MLGCAPQHVPEGLALGMRACLPACCVLVQGRRVAGRERPTASEEKNNLAIGAGWRLSHGSGSGYVKCDTEAQI